MTHEQILLFGLPGAALVLFAWGRLRYDIVAVLEVVVTPGSRMEGRTARSPCSSSTSPSSGPSPCWWCCAR